MGELAPSIYFQDLTDDIFTHLFDFIYVKEIYLYARTPDPAPVHFSLICLVPNLMSRVRRFHFPSIPSRLAK
jgi:hypothetical protein